MGTLRRSSEPPPELEFDVTQEIDPALADLLRPKPTAPLLGADADDELDPPPATRL